MIEDAVYFSNIRPDQDYINTILKLDARKLDIIDGAELSSYTVALAQYNIYRQYKVNQLLAQKMQLERNMDIGVSASLTKDILKEYKTRAAAVSFLVATNAHFEKLDQDIFDIKYQIRLVESMDNTISELIAAFKRELTRREKELFTVRQERK